MEKSNEALDKARYAYRNLTSDKESEKDELFAKIITACKTVDEIKATMRQAVTDKSKKDVITKALEMSEFTSDTDNMKWLVRNAPDNETRDKVLKKM